MTEELAGQIFVDAGFFRLEDHLDFMRNAREFLHESSRGVGGQLSANLTEVSGEQEERG